MPRKYNSNPAATAKTEIRTDFLVLRKTPYGETSLIVAGLSRDHGQIHFLVRGARKISKKTSPLVDIFRCLHIVYFEGQSELHTWHQAELAEDDTGVARNYELCQTAAWLARFALAHSTEGAESKQLFTAMTTALKELAEAAVSAQSTPADNDALTFATKCGICLIYLAENGLLPEYASGSSEADQLDILLKSALGILPRPALSPAKWRELFDWAQELVL